MRLTGDGVPTVFVLTFDGLLTERLLAVAD